MSALKPTLLLSLLASLSPYTLADDFELSGNIGLEARNFFSDGLYTEQFDHSQISLSAEPEFYWSFNGGSDSLTFKPFVRLDQHDAERTHADIRELAYIHARDNWEIRAGLRKEFWGVTEFQHLTDVINQTDSVEDSDGEDKLGQLMVNLSVVYDWGIVDVYVLPGFRERTFPGEEGRLRGPLPVSSRAISYESGAEDKHIDLAIRWSNSVGPFDIGAYWFNGTNREPLLSPAVINGETVLTQYYSQMDQIGIDTQATLGSWLWKLEAIYRDTQNDNFLATQAGFEYSFVGVFNSNTDLGVLIEYANDSRGEGSATQPTSTFQNDIFFGSRLAFNDAQSSEVLMGFSSDLDHNAVSFLAEASRRLGESFIASIDIRLFQSTEPSDLLFSIKEDDHIQMGIEWYF